MTAVGVSVPRSDGEAKVRGDAVFGVDLAVPGMLHARLLSVRPETLWVG